MPRLDESISVLFLDLLSEEMAEPTHPTRAAVTSPDHVVREVVTLVSHDLEGNTEPRQDVLERCSAEIPDVGN